MGAEAIQELLKAIDLQKDSDELRAAMKGCNWPETCKDHQEAGEVVDAFLNSGNRPEWMIMTVIPELSHRISGPMVQLDGVAASLPRLKMDFI